MFSTKHSVIIKDPSKVVHCFFEEDGEVWFDKVALLSSFLVFLQFFDVSSTRIVEEVRRLTKITSLPGAGVAFASRRFDRSLQKNPIW